MTQMKRKCDPDRRLAFVLFRYLRFWDQSEFSQAAGIAPSQTSVYEQGHRTVPDEVLARAATAAGFPVFLLPFLLRAIRTFRLIAEGRWKMPRVLGGDFAAGLFELGQSIAEAVAGPQEGPVHEIQSPEADRQNALELWKRLRDRHHSHREALVAEDEEYQTWALCERIAAESIEVAGDDSQEALKLARLALRIAKLCPGPEAWRWRLEGYAGIHVANACRVCGDLPDARKTISDKKMLWAAGAWADPGLLNEARVMQIEAGLLHAERSFSASLKMIEEAIRVDLVGITASLLYTKARILEGMDDLAGSTAALERAASLVNQDQEPRLALGIHLQLLVNLCLEDRAAEAKPKLPEIRSIAEQLGKRLDLSRVRWLEGMVAAGTRDNNEAVAAFEQVRRELADRKIAYDYALVTLELAVVLLSENRNRDVRSLAADLVWIFNSQQVGENALAALRLFQEAARRDTATVDLARQVRRFLYRAQHDPGLEFGAG